MSSASSKILHRQNSPVLKCRCQLTQVDLIMTVKCGGGCCIVLSQLVRKSLSYYLYCVLDLVK